MNMTKYFVVRVSNHTGNIETLLEKYSDNFFSLPMDIGELSSYGLFIYERDDRYLLTIVTKNNTGLSYNVVITVLGPKRERVVQLMNDFQKTIDLKTKEAPEDLKIVRKSLVRILKQQ